MIQAPLPEPAAKPDGAANAMVRTGDGRRLLGAQVCDHFALGLGIVAFPWLVLDGGGGPSLAGLVFTVAAIPYVLFGLPAGVAGDSHSRRKMNGLRAPRADALRGPPVALGTRREPAGRAFPPERLGGARRDLRQGRAGWSTSRCGH